MFFGYLGYRLFDKGLTVGESNLKFETKAMKVIFSGTGPGLFFMAFGAIVLLEAIIIGGVSVKESSTSSTTPITQTISSNQDELKAANDKITELSSQNARLEKVIQQISMRVEAPPHSE
jgi:hypothetical protein